MAGGHKLNIPGHYLEPTIFADVTPDMEIAQTEVFGPVLSILKHSSEEEALEIANGTDYGLVGGVFTKDLDKAMQVAGKNPRGPGVSSMNGMQAASKPLRRLRQERLWPRKRP